ncbi:CHASE2 domain-containing protein, partial [Nitrospiraceae bacterium AH_259_D15_M11_P09]|nr:CHASE2 domain-containing protein [Nitrospiraceae bacterium AH_259_D15_M11_P09]
IVPDPDGILRNETLLIEYRDHFYPSFALRVVSAYLNLPPREVHIGLGQYITLGRIHIPTNHLMQMPVSYNGPAGTFKPFSAHHV